MAKGRGLPGDWYLFLWIVSASAHAPVGAASRDTFHQGVLMSKRVHEVKGRGGADTSFDFPIVQSSGPHATVLLLFDPLGEQ